MKYLEKLKEISLEDMSAPNGKVPEREFIKCFQKILPNFPEDVISQWPYEDFNTFCTKPREYNKMRFTKVIMNREEINNIIDPDDFYRNVAVRDVLNKVPNTSLGLYMKLTGTWPRAIIILDKSGGNFELLEGHVRLASLRWMADAGMTVRENHEVWRVTIV